MQYDNWKANGHDGATDRISDTAADAITTAESLLNVQLSTAVSMVNGQGIGTVEVDEVIVCKSDCDDATELEAEVQLRIKLNKVQCGPDGRYGAESVCEILESIVDEIRRAAKPWK